MRRLWKRAFRGSRGGALLFTAAYSVLSLAWIVSNPVFAAPDEWSHVVRAESIAYGQLIGAPAPAPVLGPAPAGVPASAHESEERWAEQNTRRVSIPAGKTPQWFSCSADANTPALCLTGPPRSAPAAKYEIPTGNYEPFPYLLPALVARVPAAPNTIALGMRAVKALLVLTLLLVAFLVLWEPGARSLPALGLVVAITPMVVFLGSTVNPSGLEIAAAIAFFACLLRVRRKEPPGRALWVALGASGGVLALSRGQAPAWIVLDLALFLALAGVRPGLALLRRGGRDAAGAGAAVLLAIAANRVWEGLYGPHLPVGITPVGPAVTAGWLELPEVLREQVGVFDYLEFGMSPMAYIAWYSLIAAIVALALLVASRRERVVLCGAVALVGVLPVALVAAVMRHTGYGLQGRYVLAFSVVVPLLAGEIVFRRRALFVELGAGALVVPFAAIAAVVQLDGLYANARRFAVGVNGPLWFVGHAAWSPPGGWWLWLTVMVAGAALLALAAPLESWLESRRSRQMARQRQPT